MILVFILGDAGENNAIKTLLKSHSKNVQVSSTKGKIPNRSKIKELHFLPSAVDFYLFMELV